MKTPIDFIKKATAKPDIQISGEKSACWTNLQNTGSELWLDTGDIDEAASLWTGNFSALTTNNTLLNKEVQKGIYDDYIVEANTLLKNMDLNKRVIEIAFILNAHHALKLVNTFNVKVSVELHTDMANDVDRTIAYAKRFYEIDPDHFIIKVPLTPSGYIATRKIREAGIPVNFTLNFSARQNLIATVFSKPSYVNIFLGRLNAFTADNNLGDGRFVGEKATLASQNVVSRYGKANAVTTKQIAASLRSAEQIYALAGTDVFTMPVKVAKEACQAGQNTFTNQRDTVYNVQWKDAQTAEEAAMNKFWEVDEDIISFANSLNNEPPETSQEFIQRAFLAGLKDLFPLMSPEEMQQISQDGKIPVYEHWKYRIMSNDLSPDALLNLAGLTSFTNDQKALDERIRKLIE